MKAAALRLGGQGLSTTFDEHLLIIGDAAGHIDPLTGEGIHTAMMVSVAAACRSQARSSQGKPDAGHRRSCCGLRAVCWGALPAASAPQQDWGMYPAALSTLKCTQPRELRRP